MTQKKLLPGWLAASTGGFTFLLINLAIEIAFPDHWAGSPDRLLGMSYAGWSRLLWIPVLLFLFGLAGLYRHLEHALGNLGKIGYWLAAGGYVFDILGSVIEFWLYGLILVPVAGEFSTGSAGSQTGYQISSIGSLIAILGLFMFGLSCLRAALPTRWRVLPLLLSVIAISIFYFYFSEQYIIYIPLFAAIWVTIGYFLWSDS